jgi:hypothetical protein
MMYLEELEVLSRELQEWSCTMTRPDRLICHSVKITESDEIQVSEKITRASEFFLFKQQVFNFVSDFCHILWGRKGVH